MQSEMQQKISIKEKIGFACGDTACNLYFITFMTFMPYFYTNIFGLTASAMGWMFLISKIWDAVNDPLMGMLADRSNSRWGKYRPFILFGAIPFGLAGILTFTTPNLVGGYKLLYAYLTYNAVMMLYTLVNVPYCALMGVMTSNTSDRTVLASFRFIGSFIGQFVALYAVGMLPTMLGGSDKPTAKGYQITMTMLSIVAIVLLYITFFTTKERVHPPKGQKNPMGQDLADLFSNKPWLMIGIATFFQLFFIQLPSGTRPFYFQYFVQDGKVSLFGIPLDWSHEKLLTAYMLSGTFLTIIGVVLAKKLSRVVGRAFCYWGFMAIAGISTGLYYFLKPEDLNLIFILNLIRSFAMGPVSVMQWAMYTDCADYNEWKTGRRSTALIMAVSLFALKLGLALGSAAIGWILAAYHYVEKADIQPETAKHGIVLLMSLYPVIFAALGVAAMVFYPLSNKKMLEIETDLLARRKQDQS